MCQPFRRDVALVEPTTLVSLTGKLGSLASGQIGKLLRRSTLRRRVSKEVAKEARAAGIHVRAGTIRTWLKRSDVQTHLQTGSSQAIESVLDSLSWRLSGPEDTRRKQATQLLESLLRLYIRELDPSEAVAAGVGAIKQHVTDTTAPLIEATTDIAAALTDQLNLGAVFEDDLKQLHPWRRPSAVEVAAVWPPFRHLVHSLVSTRERSALLDQWAANVPQQLVDAPAEAWCWLGVTAADYGAASASFYIVRGIERGAPDASYWWARAALSDTEASEAKRREFLSNAGTHALARGQLHALDERWADADAALVEWEPIDPNDRAIKALLRSAIAVGLGDLNGAIAILLDAVAADPASSGPRLRAAEMLLSRGHLGESDHRIADFVHALTLATGARDLRRSWLGDSVPAVLVAIQAAGLSSDMDRMRRLTQAAPEGEATSDEARDDRIRREAAVCAAISGQADLARRVASELADPHTSAMVEGYIALAANEDDAAHNHLLTAWQSAPSDTVRLQILAALAPLGKGLPDTSAIEEYRTEDVQRLRALHDVASAAGDRLVLLRARQNENPQYAVMLADHHRSAGEHEAAASVLEEAGRRWAHALLLKMAAGEWLAAGAHQEAVDVSREAVLLGGHEWAGEFDALRVQFHALEAQGERDQSLVVARRLAALAPNDLTARWILIWCLLLKGSRSEAWSALTPHGTPVSPRNSDEARAWISLVAEHDKSPLFVQRVLTEMTRWADDPAIGGMFLHGIYEGQRARGVELHDDDRDALHQAIDQFTKRHPESPTWTVVKLGSDDDPLADLRSFLRHHEEPPELRRIQQQVREGQFPLGYLSESSGRSYAEAALRRAAGLIFAHDPRRAVDGVVQVGSALGNPVVLDTTAAATLAALDSDLVEHMIGAFSQLQSTDLSFQDALQAQHVLGMKSTASIGWDAENQRLAMSEITEDAAETLAQRAERVVELLTVTARRSWTLRHFVELAGGPAWIEALDYAITTRTPFWCDDLALRALAAKNSVLTFSTLDVLRALDREHRIAAGLRPVTEATLIANFFVDIEFDAPTMRFAAQLDQWRPAGAAAALTRASAWGEPVTTVDFLREAVDNNAAQAPEAVQQWVACAADGLVRIAAGDADGASSNLRLLLKLLMSHTAGRTDVLPFVVRGVRQAMNGRDGLDDPLSYVAAELYAVLADKLGDAAAATMLLAWVKSLGSADRSVVARQILLHRGKLQIEHRR